VARTYRRDSRGRFASGGGSSGGRPAAKKVSRGPNRLTRDNSGRITSVGGDGATGRGGRLRTASGKKRATQLERLKVRSSNMIGGRTARTVKGQKVMAKMAGSPKPVATGRTRAQAAMAQAKRSRRTIESTRSQVIGAIRGVTATAGGGDKIRVKTGRSTQLTLGGGSESVTKKTVKRVASSSSPAPGSKSSRRAAGVARRASETALDRLKRVKSRVAGSSNIARSRPSISERRKASYRAGVVTNGKMKKAKATEGRAFKYVLGQIDRRSSR
jgi:hypothetical protein